MAERPTKRDPIPDVHVRDMDPDEWEWFSGWSGRLRRTGGKNGTLLSALFQELRRLEANGTIDVRQILYRYLGPDQDSQR